MSEQISHYLKPQQDDGFEQRGIFALDFPTEQWYEAILTSNEGSGLNPECESLTQGDSD